MKHHLKLHSSSRRDKPADLSIKFAVCPSLYPGNGKSGWSIHEMRLVPLRATRTKHTYWIPRNISALMDVTTRILTGFHMRNEQNPNKYKELLMHSRHNVMLTPHILIPVISSNCLFLPEIWKQHKTWNFASHLLSIVLRDCWLTPEQATQAPPTLCPSLGLGRDVIYRNRSQEMKRAH